MIVKTDRGIAICMAATLLAGLTGCTAIDENMKADLASAPITKPNSAEMRAANAAEAISSGTAVATTAVTTTAELAAANPGPAPIIPGTETAAPIPMLKESSLAATAPQTAATQALTTLATATPLPGVEQQQSAISADAASVQALAAAPSSVSSGTTTAGAVPAPAPVVLAYAAPLRMTALTSFGDPFDVTAPSSPAEQEAEQKEMSGGPTKLNALIKKYAKFYEIPEDLVHRVVKRESTYNPGAYSSGNYGLMQIRYNTAKAMGYSGQPSGLFDAETNIKYAVKYLKGAWLVADNDHDQAVRLYSRGYYYDAKRKGMLHLTQ